MDSTDIVAAEVATRLDDLRIVTITDGEVWSARDLMPFAGYADWRNWSKAIDRAIASVNASGLSAADHFVGVNRMIEIGKGGRRQVEDLELTRYACYILFQNADGTKPEIAALQQYFAVQTRKQELAQPTLPKSYAEALRELAATVEAKEAAEARATELEVPASAWGVLASADGDYSVDEAAKILSRDPVITIGQNRLFSFMAEQGWVYRHGQRNRWHAYQSAVETGRLVQRMSAPFLNQNTGALELPAPTIRVTAKGLEALRRLLGGGGTASLAVVS